MKKALKRILTFAIVVCVTLIGVITAPIVGVKASADYEETTFGAGQLLITTTYNGKTYYLPTTTTGSDTAPKAVAFTDVSDISEDHLWTVTASGSNFYIQNSQGKYLYATNTNNGIRIGDTQGTWTWNSSYFKYTSLTRYLGIYNGSDWRCYNTYNASNYKGSSTNFKFYKVKEAVSNPTTDALNQVDSHMSLSYKYQHRQETVAVTGKTDTLTKSWTGVKDSSYASWSNKTLNSDAVYAGNTSGGTDIQLKSSGSTSGIVTTTSGGKVTKITVTWNSSTTDGRTLNVYGKNAPYSTPADLYNTNSAGTKLGTIVKGTSTELTITGNYEYIGLRSNSGAMYLTEIIIDWNGGESGSASGTEVVDAYQNSEFRLRCAVDASVSEIADVTEYGIYVSVVGGSKVHYNKDTATSWATAENNGAQVYYVVINLGDIINKPTRLGTEFTVQAYVIADGETYYSELSKTYSVAGLIKEYYTNENSSDETKEKVKQLYDYCASLGLI